MKVHDVIPAVEYNNKLVPHKSAWYSYTKYRATSSPKSNITESFTTSTTHMATYDDMMKDPEYFKEKKKKVFTIVHMSPDEYIDQAFRAFREQGALKPWQDKNDLYRSRSQTLVNKYADKMKHGEKFPMLVLDFSSVPAFSGGRQKSFSQEGLHRAMAAEKNGETSVPVMVVDDA